MIPHTLSNPLGGIERVSLDTYVMAHPKSQASNVLSLSFEKLSKCFTGTLKNEGSGRFDSPFGSWIPTFLGRLMAARWL